MAQIVGHQHFVRRFRLMWCVMAEASHSACAYSGLFPPSVTNLTTRRDPRQVEKASEIVTDPPDELGKRVSRDSHAFPAAAAPPFDRSLQALLQIDLGAPIEEVGRPTGVELAPGLTVRARSVPFDLAVKSA